MYNGCTQKVGHLMHVSFFHLILQNYKSQNDITAAIAKKNTNANRARNWGKEIAPFQSSDK